MSCREKHPRGIPGAGRLQIPGHRLASIAPRRIRRLTLNGVSALAIAAVAVVAVLAQVHGVSGASHEVAIMEPSADIMSWVYEPRVIEIAIGDTVSWTNMGAVPHNVIEPNGAFNSDIMNAGDTFQWSATAAGVFEYVCIYHPWMKGSVVVN